VWKRGRFCDENSGHGSRCRHRRVHDTFRVHDADFWREEYQSAHVCTPWRCELLGTMAASRNGRLSKSAFVAGALQELSCALCKGNVRMYHASMFSLARAAGQQFMPGLDVPVADVGEV
jgi:hypothetical protein